MKRYISFLLACITLLVPVGAVHADGGSVLIRPWLSSDFTVYTNQEVILGADWGACNQGLLTAFLTAIHLYWTIDGKPLFSTPNADLQYWSAPVEGGPVLPQCVRQAGNTWGAFWQYSLGKLPPGDYQVHLVYYLDHPITDGSDYNGDGSPDIFNGVILDRTTTIHVIVAPQ